MTTLWRIVLWDWRQLLRSGAAVATLLLLLAGSTLASWTGLRAQAVRADILDGARSEAVAKTPSGPAAPQTVQLRILLAAPPLGDFVVGRAGLDPLLAEAGPLTPLHRVFENYQLDNPWTLALARFDFAMLASIVAPLILIALCTGLLAEERRSGRLALLLAHGAGIGQLLSGRLIARTLLVLLPLLLALCVQLWLGGGAGDGRGPAFGLFVTATVLGLSFWAGLCAAVNVLPIGGATSAASLFVAWLLLTVVGPAGVGLATQALSPTPSRIAFLAEARAAELEAVKSAPQLSSAFLNDHPELETGSFDVPDWARSSFVVSEQVNTATQPLRERFVAALGRQVTLAGALQGLSPTLAQTLVFLDASGTGAAAALATQSAALAQVAAMRAELGPLVMARQGVEPAQQQRWRLAELRSPAASAAASLAWLLGWCTVACAAAQILYRRGIAG